MEALAEAKQLFWRTNSRLKGQCSGGQDGISEYICIIAAAYTHDITVAQQIRMVNDHATTV